MPQQNWWAPLLMGASQGLLRASQGGPAGGPPPSPLAGAGLGLGAALQQQMAQRALEEQERIKREREDAMLRQRQQNWERSFGLDEKQFGLSKAQQAATLANMEADNLRADQSLGLDRERLDFQKGAEGRAERRAMRRLAMESAAQRKARQAKADAIRGSNPDMARLIEAGFDTKEAQDILVGKPKKAPTTRTIRDGTDLVYQEYDPAAGEYREVGRGPVIGRTAQDAEALKGRPRDKAQGAIMAGEQALGAIKRLREAVKNDDAIGIKGLFNEHVGGLAQTFFGKGVVGNKPTEVKVLRTYMNEFTNQIVRIMEGDNRFSNEDRIAAQKLNSAMDLSTSYEQYMGQLDALEELFTSRIDAAKKALDGPVGSPRDYTAPSERTINGKRYAKNASGQWVELD